MIVTSKREKQVCDLEDNGELILLTDSQDIDAVKEYLGNPDWFDYGCLFVKIGEGDYEEIYGCESNVPYNHYWVDTIEWEI